jgi:hypothetical protein
MARSVADAALSIVLAVVAIASDAAGVGAMVVVDVVVDEVPGAVSVTVVFFSQAASKAAAASIETRASGVLLVCMVSPESVVATNIVGTRRRATTHRTQVVPSADARSGSCLTRCCR